MSRRNEGPSLPSDRRPSVRPWALVLALAAAGCSSAPPPPPTPAPVSAPAEPAAPKVELEKRLGTSWFQHGDGIRSVAVTKDGATVLSCAEKSIVAFDASSGAERQRLVTSCMRAAMSPDASRLAVIAEEKLSLYAVTDHELKPEPLWTVPVPKVFYQAHFRELTFASDGRTLGVRLGWEDFRTYDAVTGKLLASHGFKSGYPDNELVVLGPGGKSIVVTSRSPSLGTRLLSFDTGATLTLEPPARLLGVWGTTEGAKSFRWSRDGQLLLGTARLDNPNEEIICLWNAATGKLVGSWPFGDDRVDAAAFSRDEKSILAMSDKELWQIDLASGTVDKHAREAADAQDLALSPDGRFLFSGHNDGGIRRWDLSLKADTTPAVQTYGCAALSPEGTLALVGGRELVLVDAKGEHRLSTTEAKGRVKFSPSGKALMTGGSELQIWSTESNKLVTTMTNGMWPRVALADGWLAFVQYDEWFLYRKRYSSAGIKDLATLDLGTPCIGGNFADIALSRDQTKLAVVYGPGFDQDVCKDADADSFPGNARPRSKAGESPYRVRVYETKRWTVAASRGATGSQRPSIAIEADGDLMALATDAGVELWSSVQRRTIGKFEVNAELAEITFVPDRHWVAVGLANGKVQIYDYEHDSLVAELNAHPGAVQCLDATSTRLVSTGFEGTAAIWTMSGGAPAKKP